MGVMPSIALITSGIEDADYRSASAREPIWASRLEAGKPKGAACPPPVLADQGAYQSYTTKLDQLWRVSAR